MPLDTKSQKQTNKEEVISAPLNLVIRFPQQRHITDKPLAVTPQTHSKLPISIILLGVTDK